MVSFVFAHGSCLDIQNVQEFQQQSDEVIYGRPGQSALMCSVALQHITSRLTEHTQPTSPTYSRCFWDVVWPVSVHELSLVTSLTPAETDPRCG